MLRTKGSQLTLEVDSLVVLYFAITNVRFVATSSTATTTMTTTAATLKLSTTLN